MSTLISSILVDCLKRFNFLKSETHLKAYASEVPPDAWVDELGRLRIWAANIGAHRIGEASLDFRLRDASHIRAQTVKLLEQLRRTLDDAEELFTGTTEENGDFSADKDEETELQQVYKNLIYTIDCLFQMSMIIRRPAQHDRLLGTNRLDATGFEFHDRQHVAHKYPKARSIVINRLGDAISRRRAALKYRERHHAKLAEGIDSAFAQLTDRRSADQDKPREVVSTLPLQTTAMADQESHIDFEDSESNSGASHTSYAPSLWRCSDNITVPKIPRNAYYGKAFECPYCFFIITAPNRSSWARHVFKDLMPYICVFHNCTAPNRLYDSRREWFQHLLAKHIPSFDPKEVDECPLRCGSNVPVVLLERHLARHLEELALFALPRAGMEDEETSDESRGTNEAREGFDEASSTSFSKDPVPVIQSPSRDLLVPDTAKPEASTTNFSESEALADRSEGTWHQQIDIPNDRLQDWDADTKTLDSLEQLHVFEERPTVQPEGLPGMQSLRKPSAQKRRVFVSNLANEVKRDYLRDFMRQAGKVLTADILLLPTGVSRGCAVVEYASKEQARHAVLTLNRQRLMGRPVDVREDTESRLNEPTVGRYRRALEPQFPPNGPIPGSHNSGAAGAMFEPPTNAQSMSHDTRRSPQTVHNLVPAEGAISGGVEVVLPENGFCQGQEVMFGDTEATVWRS
ncbi:hypothetical protein H2200_007922 [Cladophialophora chaetospira]|uniref:RRM domain-containing protein n=1 Tax=Cladophialophora chaetospira TaxID=386627 RepID=A0AA39CH21_9EURO|nr:hypothetical protein H2200_007922 [Cladophialophora chaetospira]